MPIDAPTIRIPQIVIASALPLGIKRDTANATAIATAKDSKARQVLTRFKIEIIT
jgi:hypothetical protein